MSEVKSDELERKNDEGFYSQHWIILRQMKRLWHPGWRKAYPHQADREHPEWWDRYAKKFLAGPDRMHRFARISFTKTPGTSQIVTA